jgi:hypothetical protein
LPVTNKGARLRSSASHPPREDSYQAAKSWIGALLGRSAEFKPATLALSALWPFLLPRLNSEGKDFEAATYGSTTTDLFSVLDGAQCVAGNLALHARFLKRLGFGSLPRCIFRPALRNNPPLRSSRRDQEDLDGAVPFAEGNRSVLLVRLRHGVSKNKKFGFNGGCGPAMRGDPNA